jgi:hypothetical protein
VQVATKEGIFAAPGGRCDLCGVGPAGGGRLVGAGGEGAVDEHREWAEVRVISWVIYLHRNAL